MAHDPVSTSIFHKYLLTDNPAGLCLVQVMFITDPTPLNSVQLYIRCWHFSKGPEEPEANLICGELYLSRGRQGGGGEGGMRSDEKK